MSPRFFAIAASLLLPLACSPDATDPIEPTGTAGLSDFAGTYQVSGRTVEEESGEGRDIAGTVVIRPAAEGYEASFKLTTLFPTSDGASEAQVVGTGEGRLEGGALEGTADTQIILAEVPGVNADFAFLPRSYGPRIRSSSTARLDEDGALVIEIVSEPAEGEAYRTTRTQVRGTRIETPDVAAGLAEQVEAASEEAEAAASEEAEAGATP